jgi:hypothetical protein
MRATMPPYTSQQPTGAYRSTEVIGDKESRLRTALSFINHARDLVRAELGHGQPQTAKQAYDNQTRRDVSWSAKRGDYTLPKWHAEWGKPRNDELPSILEEAVSHPDDPRINNAAFINRLCDQLRAESLMGIGIGDVPHESRHPMAAEADRLSGPEDRL